LFDRVAVKGARATLPGTYGWALAVTTQAIETPISIDAEYANRLMTELPFLSHASDFPSCVWRRLL
jgi:hypothetical protein